MPLSWCRLLYRNKQKLVTIYEETRQTSMDLDYDSNWYIRFNY